MNETSGAPGSGINPHTGAPAPAQESTAPPDAAASGVPPEQESNFPPATAAPGIPAGQGSTFPAAAAAGLPSAPDPAAAASAPSGTSEAPSQQELAIRSALETVMDPEINLSVIDLGLIREIRLEPERTLVRMMLTTPFCPYAPQLMEEVKQATQSVVPVACEVEIMPDPWSPDLMPDPGLLGFSY